MVPLLYVAVLWTAVSWFHRVGNATAGQGQPRRANPDGLGGVGPETAYRTNVRAMDHMAHLLPLWDWAAARRPREGTAQ